MLAAEDWLFWPMLGLGLVAFVGVVSGARFVFGALRNRPPMDG
jgi:hypothetical protein